MYTVILYLTDGVDSTAFPQFALNEFAVPEIDSDEQVLNVAALRATVERGCLNKERYDRWLVRVGDMAIFTQATMHFGTKNNILHERMALFSVLTPFTGKRQDDYQIYRSACQALQLKRHASKCQGCVEVLIWISVSVCVIFRWLYVGFAYGDQSRELAQALWRDREFEPLDRFSANEAGRQSYQAYIACLLRWGYIHWNPHARKGASKMQWAPEEEHRSAPLDEEAVAALYYAE